MSKIKTILSKLNKPQLGSFGEYVFADYVTNKLKKDIFSLHRDGYDFIFEKNKIDVGSSLKLGWEVSERPIKNKNASVLFFDEYCLIICAEHFKSVKIKWSKISTLFQRWKKGHKLAKAGKTKHSYQKEYTLLKTSISDFFNTKGYQTRIIYRTVSSQFGLRESPGNLLPQKIHPKRISVYIDFINYKRIKSNINFIIAFEDCFHKEIPRQNKITIKSGKENFEKVDLIKILKKGHRCCFRTLDELEKTFFKNYPIIK